MTAATLPELPGIGAPVPAKRYLLACLDGQRRLRVIVGGAELERWVRAYARRWWVVTAASEEDARRAIQQYVRGHGVLPAPQLGIIAAGHNAAGGPRALPRALGGVPIREAAPAKSLL